MKVKLDIDQQYIEEQIIIEAPTLSPRVQKVQDFVQSLDQKETLKGKFQDQVYLIQISKIQRIYIENRKVLAETDSQTYALDIRLYRASEILPASFIQISQSEIVNKMVFNRFVSKRSLLQLYKGEIMKLRLDIDQQYTEEQIIIEAPALSSKIQKVQDFVQSLDQKETIKGKFQDQVYLIQISKIQRVYIENRKVLAETDSQTYALDIRLYQASEILPASFIQISQSEIVNIDAISHLKLTSNGLIEIYLKNESFTYSSRRYLKTIKEKLEL